MSTIVKTELLESILNKAKVLPGAGEGTLTAERFVYCAIDEIMERGGKDRELLAAGILLANYKINLAQVKRKLDEYLKGKKEVEAEELSYFEEKLSVAGAIVEEKGIKSLTLEALLKQIFEKPNQNIQNLVLSKEEDLPKQEKKSGVGDDFDRHSSSEGEEKTETDDTDSKGKIASLVSEVKTIREELGKRVFGQENAVDTFASGYFQANLLALTDKSRTRPKATFLFAGPPGVGKTFLAEQVADLLKVPFKRFDMSEYSNKEAALEFCGSDKVYRNGSQGNLTKFLSENPECVLLFDEIEKAHISIIHLFLQILDAGRVRDNFTDEEVSFKKAVIIMTTNAGRQLYQDGDVDNFAGVSRKVIIKALQNDINPETDAPYFPSAICSRFASGNVVMFNHITASNLRTIAKKEIGRHAENFRNETGIDVFVAEGVYSALLLAEGAKADARTIRARSETFLNSEFFELFRLLPVRGTQSAVSQLEKINITLDLDSADSEIQAFFVPFEKPSILVFADEECISSCEARLNGVNVIGVSSAERAIRAIKENDIAFALVDIASGRNETSNPVLNVEDVDSPVRDFLKFLLDNGQTLPVYIFEDEKYNISDEERVSLQRYNIRGGVPVSRENDSFENKIDEIVSMLHQQSSMEKLARESKALAFETSQSLSEDGKVATIKLFDFTRKLVVDSEDSKSIISDVSRPDIKLADVIGAEDAKRELVYFIEYLRNPKKYMGTGVKAPRGVLLYGEPGTGKTLLAKAMAAEAGVTFVAAEGNQFLKRYVGEGSASVHEIFAKARKYAPSILFIDEIDAIAKERSNSDNNSGDEETLTAFLTEMDGFSTDPSKPVFVLAATNYDVEPGTAKSLDPALMRRFDRRIYIDLPKKEERIRFLKMKVEKLQALVISDEKIDNIAMRSTGMSLAALDSVVELALRSAIRDGSTVVTDEIFDEAFETFNSGEKKKWDEDQLERVARHEAGHALLCYLNGETPSYLTVVARGGHGGYMQHADREGKAIYTKAELLGRVRTSLGGRAAELVCYGEEAGVSTGASGDLRSATDTARRIICSYGMDDAFGLSVLSNNEIEFGESSGVLREAVNRILSEQMQESVRLITENKDKLDALVENLMLHNHLTGAEIEKILG